MIGSLLISQLNTLKREKFMANQQPDNRPHQKGEFGRDGIMVGGNVAIAIDILSLKNSSLSSLIVGPRANSLDAIILMPISLFIIGFIPILGGIGIFGSLLTLLGSLQQLAFFPGSLGLLTGVMSGINFRKSLIG